MKVTVCFGSVRVVVPCGHGDILVRDLVREAILRYKKATGKGSDSWVSVHNLQSQGGGILDPDDRLSDVVDDREQILANFEDGDGTHQHGGGDGASGSSVGTGSPDIFHDGEHKYGPNYPRTDIEVTGEQIALGVPGALQVRRGSEPALNQLPVGPPAPPEHPKRWSAAPLILEPPQIGYNSNDWNEDSKEEEGTNAGFRRRDGSNRLSMQFLGDGAGYRWAEAAERAAQSRASTSLPRESKRKEPLGQANNSTSPPPPSDNAELIVIRNEPGPLGIHVVPDYDRLGKDRGLLVQGIEPGKRIDRDGRLAIYDRIIEINGENLLNMPFQRVQDIFKLYLNSPELRLKVIKNSGLDSLRKPPAPIYPRFPEDKENVSMVECEQKPFAESTNTKVATVSPTKKVPAISKNLKTFLSANTRKIGRKYEIDLIKGPHGLGFSITTRDNPAGGNCPIYIKNIIPKGAAVEDGRLKIGDRLLEVNGVEMTGKSQAEAVAVLRNAPLGSTVRIVVSRQEDVIDNSLPRIIDSEQEKEVEDSAEVVNGNDVPPNIPPLPQSHLQALQNRSEKNGSVAKIVSQFQEAANNPPDKTDDMIFPWKHREILTLNIPVHDSEKAGLGISVKGKTSGTQDLGIFIKSVIHGGAASRDKRLRTNDQLLNVNGISLLQQSNSDAMETLRKAMLHTEGPVPGNITLTIARRAASPGANRSFSSRGSDPNLLNTSSSGELFHSNSNSNDTDPSHSNNSGASGSSTNTVIFNPNQNGVEAKQMQNVSQMHTWNPVLDRLTGNNKQLRNESYYKATHDTWSNSMLASANNSYGNMTSTTLSLAPAEPILIEDEYGSRVLTHQNSRINVHMTNKMNLSNGSIPENRNDHEPDGKANVSDNKSTDSNSQTTIQGTDATYASQLSLENPQGFSRDAFGRQSMSEKRHATLDAKNTDTYQRTKKLREERKSKDGNTNLVRVGSVESVISVNRSSEHPEYADKLGQLGPSLGMKKSSSLESLQTMVQEIQMQEEGDPAYSYRGPSGALKVIRGRGCEESFRAAVDKHIVDPNHQSEISAKKHWLLDGPMEEREIDGFNNVRGAPRQSSLNAALDSKHKSGKKKPSLLKGIGSMFRFGKHRKMEFNNIDIQHYHPTNEFDPNANNNQQQQQAEQQNYQQQQHENSSQEQQQQRAQQMIQQQREPLYQRHGFVHRHAEQVQVIPENSVAPPVKYRNHVTVDQQGQRRKMQEHRMRHTYYQSDDREPIYGQQGNFGEYGGRPGSRSGITDSVPFTHYVNYNELQNHLSRKDPLSDSQIVQMRLQVQQQRLKVEEESRKQHQYHSQRQTRTDNQLRPVSNFYEYESIQSMLNNRRGNPPVPHSNPPVMYQDVNSNSLPRQGQPPVQGRHPNRNHRGPFVTHVTIGDSQQNGTKV
ncbi:partitioning defective 3 homolog B-like isoform X4 [Tribolium madens]|uniref:partitioning defective 3 homolog B-like isoform X4 n=1 Tax=Tribolium madens TaxID=41895 RepID=UPI001CF73B4B|nr:partitioning defective 3 homolog B-like isoform X4 [Tribolium madens]